MTSSVRARTLGHHKLQALRPKAKQNGWTNVKAMITFRYHSACISQAPLDVLDLGGPWNEFKALLDLRMQTKTFSDRTDWSRLVVTVRELIPEYRELLTKL